MCTSVPEGTQSVFEYLNRNAHDGPTALANFVKNEASVSHDVQLLSVRDRIQQHLQAARDAITPLLVISIVLVLVSLLKSLHTDLCSSQKSTEPVSGHDTKAHRASI